MSGPPSECQARHGVPAESATRARIALVATAGGKHLVLIARSATGAMRARVADSTGTTWRAWHSLGGPLMESGSAAVTIGDHVFTIAQGTDHRVLVGAITDIGAGLRFSGWHRIRAGSG